ncbi:MAG: hypothetical protein ACLU8D_10040 [Enterocloster sp.]
MHDRGGGGPWDPLKIVGCSLALFSVTIAVLCASTNAVWYAG